MNEQERDAIAQAAKAFAQELANLPDNDFAVRDLPVQSFEIIGHSDDRLFVASVAITEQPGSRFPENTGMLLELKLEDDEFVVTGLMGAAYEIDDESSE
jgi:hypothetical protein